MESGITTFLFRARSFSLDESGPRYLLEKAEFAEKIKKKARKGKDYEIRVTA